MSEYLIKEYNEKVKIVNSNIQKLENLEVFAESEILLLRKIQEKVSISLEKKLEFNAVYQEAFHMLDELNVSLEFNLNFYCPISNKYKKINTRMQHLRKEQIHSTGLEIIALLKLLKEKESIVFQNQKINENLTHLLYACILLEICYEGTHTLFDLIKEEEISFPLIEENIKKDLSLEEFQLQKDLNEDLLFLLEEKKKKELKEKYILQIHSYENFNKEYKSLGKKETILKIKEIKKKKNRVWIKQWKRRLFGLFCLGLINFGFMGSFFVTEQKEEIVEEKELERNDFCLFLEDFLSSHPFFSSGMFLFDLLAFSLFCKRMQDGPFGKEMEEIQEKLQELERLLEMEEKEKQTIHHRLVEWSNELLDIYDRLPKSLKEDSELKVRMRLVERERRK